MTDEGLISKTKAELPLGPEGNVLTSALVFVVALVLDGLCAVPTTTVLDVPTSLRTTALVLSCLVAAPPITADWLFEQRGIAFVGLLLVAWVGLHEGALYSRIADSIYTLLGGWATLFFFCFSAPTTKENGRDEKGRRENVTALCSAFLGYSGARIVRQGLAHAAIVTGFTATHSGVISQGYAIADDLCASILVFGGVVAMAAAVTLLTNHDSIYMHGSEPVSRVMAQLAAVLFTAALVVQIVSWSRMQHLTAVFGETACSGTYDDCEVAYRTRRLFVANSSAAPLWALAVGLTIVSFPYGRRCRSRKSFYRPTEDRFRETSYSSGMILLISSVIVVLVTLYYSPTDNYIPGIELLLLYFSIPAAWFSWAPVACLLHFAGFSIYVINRLGSVWGFDLRMLTHVIMAISLFLIFSLAVTTALSFVLNLSMCSWRSCNSPRAVIEDISAVLLTVFVSLQLFLVNASLSLVSAYDGSALEDAKEWRHAAITNCVQHTLSFFFAAALVGGRFEPFNENINTLFLRIAWFGVPIAAFVSWGVILLVRSSDALPYVSTGDPAALAIALLAAVAPWISAGVVVC